MGITPALRLGEIEIVFWAQLITRFLGSYYEQDMNLKEIAALLLHRDLRVANNLLLSYAKARILPISLTDTCTSPAINAALMVALPPG